MPETWLKVKEAARLWNVCERTIDRMGRRGEITVVKLSPRIKRVLVWTEDDHGQVQGQEPGQGREEVGAQR